jgi:hypothetical protein
MATLGEFRAHTDASQEVYIVLRHVHSHRHFGAESAWFGQGMAATFSGGNNQGRNTRLTCCSQGWFSKNKREGAHIFLS